MRVGADDRFYALDYSGLGNILSWDQQITTNSMLSVMGDDNNPGGDQLFSGFFITGTGTNRQVWMADNLSGGYGINLWNMQPDGTLATNDLGTAAVQVGGDLADSAYDVAVDTNGNIYALCQPANSSHDKYLRFPAYTNTPLLTADWGADTNSDISDPWAIAVNPAATYVAAALSESDAVLILDANTGTNVATISSNGYPHYAVAWDNAGNVYTCFDVSETNSIWQVWSPPGTNQATTLGLEVIYVPAGAADHEHCPERPESYHPLHRPSQLSSGGIHRAGRVGAKRGDECFGRKHHRWRRRVPGCCAGRQLDALLPHSDAKHGFLGLHHANASFRRNRHLEFRRVIK